MKLALIFAVLVCSDRAIGGEIQVLEATPECVENETYPHHHDCRQYYRCIEGWLVLEACDSDNVYNSSTRQCVSPDSPDDDCTKKTTIEPTTITEGCVHDETLPYPEICQMYLRCQNGSMVIETCASDSVYSWSAKQCVSPNSPDDDCTHKTTIEPTTITEGCVHNETLPYPEICQMYLRCQNGSMVIETCASDSVYSWSAKQCVSPNSPDDDCTQRTTTTEPITDPTEERTTTTEPSTAAQNISVEKEECIAGESYPVPNECRAFYFCNKGKLEYKVCFLFLNFVFSRSLKHCVPQYSPHADCEEATTPAA